MSPQNIKAGEMGIRDSNPMEHLIEFSPIFKPAHAPLILTPAPFLNRSFAKLNMQIALRLVSLLPFLIAASGTSHEAEGIPARGLAKRHFNYEPDLPVTEFKGKDISLDAQARAEESVTLIPAQVRREEDFISPDLQVRRKENFISSDTQL
ncbi:hypothetical protein GALMADRAFT_147281 [Galerina marginata CBS 339.88]|uniref:Uncharacterized protein n=1 Tax=Galerina marginata (strain CBS 339.88) TaxID=685588 RepID=A0A067SBF3_GALM3|nr:hypothetical protein GALMADRAFT_147281 [Galerina marginata CBS 339.88]